MPGKLHLGCGYHIMPGWVNIDIDSIVADVHLDLRNPIPYSDKSILYIFSEHFIEHLSIEEARIFLRECYRVLVPKGVLRVTTPNLKFLVEHYLSEDLSSWKDVGWMPQTACQMVNEGMTLWGHKFLYDQPEIEKLFLSVGFSSVTFCSWGHSDHYHLCNLECRPYHGELIVEGTK